LQEGGLLQGCKPFLQLTQAQRKWSRGSISL
jgi:hypothetical protein